MPAGDVAWRKTDREDRISVPLRLSPTSTKDPAELWVIRNNAIEQIEQLVSNADDQLVSQLSFAVAGTDEEPIVILRARPSRAAPPVLVLDGVGFRSYLKLSDLFLPVGSNLHPPLRRDAVGKLFHQKTARLSWLYPGEDRSFTPESIDEEAFRPLTDWVDYIIDRDHEALQAWVSSYRFDFELFVCDQDPQRKPRPPRKAAAPPKPTKQATNVRSGPVKTSADTTEETDAPSELSNMLDVERAKPEPNEMQVHLHGLERQYNESDEPLDSPRRSQLWREMGVANALLRRRHDATVCWSNGLWEETAPSAAGLADWIRSESVEHSTEEIGIDDVLLWIDDPTTPAYASNVAAFLVCAASGNGSQAGVTEQLGKISQYLERQEPYLPTRTAWLAWLAVAQLSQGDVLALARARDRLLERLFQHGLRAGVRSANLLARQRRRRSGSLSRRPRTRCPDPRGRRPLDSRATNHGAYQGLLRFTLRVCAGPAW